MKAAQGVLCDFYVLQAILFNDFMHHIQMRTRLRNTNR